MNLSFHSNLNRKSVCFIGDVDVLDFCIQMTSSASPPCNYQWSGSNIALYHNGLLIFTFESSFSNLQKCIPLNSIDRANDIFTLKITGTDNVSQDFR